jgi:hypothetical protein
MQAQREQAAQAQRRQQELQGSVSELLQNPTAQGIVNLQVQFPEIAKQLDYARQGQSDIDKQANLDQAIKIYAPLEAGNDAGAIRNAETLAEAFRNSGDEEQAKEMDDLANLIKTNRNAAYVQSGLYVAQSDPETFEKIRKDKLAGEIQPYEIEKIKAQTEKARRPSAPLVSIGSPQQETAYLKEIGKGQAERINRIVAEGENARDSLSTADQLLAFGDINTGTFEPLKATLSATLSGIGVPPALADKVANAGNAQALEAIANTAVNAVLNLAKGPQTEGDAQRAKTTIAALKDDPRAFRFKANTMKAVALRKVEQAEFYNKGVDEKKSPIQINKEWREHIRDIPNISAKVKTDDGLPMYYFQFRERIKERYPDASEGDIEETWREAQ